MCGRGGSLALCSGRREHCYRRGDTGEWSVDLDRTSLWLTGPIFIDQSGADSLPILAFWTYNITILIYLIQSDTVMSDVCEDRDLLRMLREILNSMQGKRKCSFGLQQ